MMMKFLFYFVFHNGIFNPTANAFNCHLPEGCRLEKYFFYENVDMNEIGSRDKSFFIRCDIKNNEFRFKFKEPPNFITGEQCIIDSNNFTTPQIVFKWTSSKELTILDREFNFTNVFRYNSYMKDESNVYLWGLKGFDLSFFLDSKWINYKSIIRMIHLSKLHLDFYHDKKRINSCDDIFKSNITAISSIFQMNSQYDIYQIIGMNFIIRNIEVKQNICPLVFKNSFIMSFMLIDLADTFYKRNVLSFTNETFRNLNSDISIIQLYKLQNVNLDLKLFNPSVFIQTTGIYISSGSLNLIDGAIFKNLKSLLEFGIDPVIFRKINHKQGIEWIRQWNLGKNVNLSELKENKSNTTINVIEKKILLIKDARKPMSNVFPDKDFCIYVDFPFNQFVILYEQTVMIYEQIENNINFIYKNKELSCTYLWLVQYYDFYYNYYLTYKNYDTISLSNLMNVLNTTSFKSISKCNFEEKVKLCNKSNYHVKDIWDESDIFILSKKMQIAFKIMIYPTAFLGFITNIIVVIVILKKENTDLFKQFKQYSYLYLNSIFCITIMVIELLSWMTECFYPFEVFCPEIRKLVPIQFFKIIFKECLITLLRFMCSFTYIAFALNRISLIGKDHGKLVTFFSELGIKVFIGVTLFISCSLSWIKGFKYQVNYFYPYFNYPISNEMDIRTRVSYYAPWTEPYFIINFICDLFNYVVFVVTCVIIDICMVVQLREVLEEKTKKSESLNQKQNENKKAENDKAVKKAIKMVVLNSAIGIFFKLPASFISLLNVVAEFYYKDNINRYNDIYNHPNFGLFYSMLQDTELYSLIQDISYFLYTLSLSIPIFIYNGFDKKFQTGFERLKEKAFSYIKNPFKKSNNSNS